MEWPRKHHPLSFPSGASLGSFPTPRTYFLLSTSKISEGCVGVGFSRCSPKGVPSLKKGKDRIPDLQVVMEPEEFHASQSNVSGQEGITLWLECLLVHFS